MSVKDHFDMMAAYNAWANNRLYDAAAALPDEDYRRDMGAFFKSIHRTLNHLYGTDMIWMSRFRGLPNPPWTLDHIAHDELSCLRKRRVMMDHDILGFVGGLTEPMLSEDLSFTTIADPSQVTQRLDAALAHFFNHQTHHRGQCHAMLTQLGTEAPPLDLLYYQREN